MSEFLFDLSANYYEQFVVNGALDEKAILEAGYNEQQIEPIRQLLISNGKLKAAKEEGE